MAYIDISIVKYSFWVWDGVCMAIEQKNGILEMHELRQLPILTQLLTFLSIMSAGAVERRMRWTCSGLYHPICLKEILISHGL